MSNTGKALYAAVALIGVAYGILVYWLLWCWFAVPLGAPSISALHVAGLRLLIWHPQYDPPSEPDPAEWLARLAFGWMTSTFVLAIGWALSFGV